MSGTAEPTPEELAAASEATQSEQAAAASVTAPPTRPRRALPVIDPNMATPMEVQAAQQALMDATDTTTLSELDRTYLETAAGIARNLRAEQEQAQLTQLSLDAQAAQAASQEKYEAALVEHNERMKEIAAAADVDPTTPEGYRRVKITGNVTIIRDDYTTATYTVTGTNTGIPGVWDMPIEDAEHDYLQHFTENPPPLPPPLPGTAGAIAIAQRVAAARAQAESVYQQQEEMAVMKARSERVAEMQAKYGDSFQPTLAETTPVPPTP